MGRRCTGRPLYATPLIEAPLHRAPKGRGAIKQEISVTPKPTTPNDAPDWRAFRTWLIDERGVSRRTATTAASQVRRVLRDAVETSDGEARVTRASLLRWHDAQESHKRTPIVSNWRRYREWWASQGVEGLPDFPRRTAVRDGEIPLEVAKALAALQGMGVSFPVLSVLRWCPLPADDTLRNALAATTPGLQDGSMVALLADSGIVILPTVHIQPVLAWGHAGAPERDAPVVPASPGNAEPMPLTRMRRLARRGRKA